jgi:hypothetical protein
VRSVCSLRGLHYPPIPPHVHRAEASNRPPGTSSKARPAKIAAFFRLLAAPSIVLPAKTSIPRSFYLS